MRAQFMALVLGFGFATAGMAQTPNEAILERRFDGEELANIFAAWTTVEREFRPEAQLKDFYVRYSATQRSITIWFFKPNTVTRTENGETVLHFDLLSYRTVIEDGVVRIIRD